MADGGKVILMSHLGRPKTGPEDKFSLKHLVKHLSDLLDGARCYLPMIVWESKPTLLLI
nr:phosphoglycerate kinase [Niabella hibiscisoli]